jgi:hypothetical protein
VGSWNCAVGGERRLKSRHNLRHVSAHISLELVVSSASEFIAFARGPEIRKYKLNTIFFQCISVAVFRTRYFAVEDLDLKVILRCIALRT